MLDLMDLRVRRIGLAWELPLDACYATLNASCPWARERGNLVQGVASLRFHIGSGVYFGDIGGDDVFGLAYVRVYLHATENFFHHLYSPDTQVMTPAQIAREYDEAINASLEVYDAA